MRRMKRMIDISVIKRLEGKKVGITANIGNRCAVYSNIVYEFTAKGTIEFVDKKTNKTCWLSSECIEEVHEAE